MSKQKINILGTVYTIKILKDSQFLKDCDGYCDKTSKEIVVRELTSDNSNLDDPKLQEKKIMRHEIIHAFLFESGLGENLEHHTWGHNETIIDWLAIQGEKIYKAWREAGCLNE